MTSIPLMVCMKNEEALLWKPRLFLCGLIHQGQLLLAQCPTQCNSPLSALSTMFHRQGPPLKGALQTLSPSASTPNSTAHPASQLGNLFWVSSWQPKAGPRLWVANALLPAEPELKIYLCTSSEKRFTKQTNSGWGMGSVDNKPRQDKLCSRNTFPKTGFSAHSSMPKTSKSFPIVFPRS